MWQQRVNLASVTTWQEQLTFTIFIQLKIFFSHDIHQVMAASPTAEGLEGQDGRCKVSQMAKSI